MALTCQHDDRFAILGLAAFLPPSTSPERLYGLPDPRLDGILEAEHGDKQGIGGGLLIFPVG